MSYTKTVWVDEEVENPKGYEIDDGGVITDVTINRKPGAIAVEGTEFTATKMNNMEDGIEDAHNRANNAQNTANSASQAAQTALNEIEGLPKRFEKIQEIVLANNTNIVTFSDIPSKYNELKLLFHASAQGSGDRHLIIKMNQSTQFSYSRFRLLLNTQEVSSTGSNYAPEIILNDALSNELFYLSQGEMNMTNTNNIKTFYGTYCLQSDFDAPQHNIFSGRYKSFIKISKIDLRPSTGRSFIASSKFTLLGLE